MRKNADHLASIGCVHCTLRALDSQQDISTHIVDI